MTMGSDETESVRVDGARRSRTGQNVWRMSWPARVGVPHALLLAVGFALLAAGCSRSGYQYVENEDEGIFVKVPDDWEVTELDQLPENDAQTLGDLLLEPVVPDSEPWLVALSSPDHELGQVVGQVTMMPIGSEFRDQVSTTAMRAVTSPLGLGDPVELAASEGSDFQILLDRDLADSPLRGNRVVYNFSGERVPRTFDQIFFVDEANRRLYGLVLSCATTCYRANAEVIDEIIESFTVEEE
jgi:hypothetical protein